MGAQTYGSVPRMLGRYHVLEALGQSSLGVLHLARLEGPNKFQRWAVVRLLHPDLAQRPALVQAFYDAARFSARVQHPNVAIVFDVGEAKEPPWAAYEYVHGETVADLLTRAIERATPVPWDIACRIISDAALGLDAVYEVVASDPRVGSLLQGPISPSSLMVGYDGKTKVLDACLRTLDPSALPYSAPEEATVAADARADVFGLGVLLWELCAGRRLFAGDSVEHTRELLAANFVPPLKTLVRCPTKLQQILDCALSRDPGARYQTARGFARALQGVVVAKGLVLTDDVVARYLFGVFEDRFEARQELLSSAANVTEVFRREELAELLGAPDTLRDVSILEGPTSGPGPYSAPTRPGIHLVPESHELPTRPRARDDGFHELPTLPREQPGAASELPTLPRNGVGGTLQLARSPAQVAELSSTAPLPTQPLPDPVSAPFFLVQPASEAPMSPLPETPMGPVPMAHPVTPPPPPPTPTEEQEALPRRTGLALALLGMAITASVVLVVRLIQLRRAAAPAPVASVMVAASVAATPLAASSVPPTPAAPTASTLAAASTTAAPSPAPDPASVAPNPIFQAPDPASAAPEPSPPRTRQASRRLPPASRPAANDDDTPAPAPAPAGETGQLTVVCSPACDEVLDGSRSLGPSPVFKVPVATGTHQLTLRTVDPPVERTVTVTIVADTTSVVRQSMGQ